ncbi:AAA-like domain-containing protein [Mediterraneibacter glycyrrhizinilyticus]|uniref:AAA-like domain-containing protein n=1 Tax=Mediterraneibacter glycyrrhizinilyticus TaxID=342942 RepID=UPI00195FCD34|nr:AAA-like domain-containing protein [Mediterraneibacter glycyrrhizinilyticus]MBM6752173.1 AAA-like domain-containing protein [Mediterraneibacter glycyrrhizinilyticus]
MSRTFNITADCKPSLHYMVDITDRLEKIKKMIDAGQYFTINRARQYGKTTTLRALAKYLVQDYIVVSLDFQLLSHNDFAEEGAFVKAFSEAVLRKAGEGDIPAEIRRNLQELIGESQKATLGGLFEILSVWCRISRKPIVMIIDEVDSASNNQVFLDFLSQLRGYYIDRDVTPTFQSVILAGVYDIKNIKRKIRSDEDHKNNSPWNMREGNEENESLLSFDDCPRDHKELAPYDIAAKFRVDMSFSQKDITGMLKEYEKDYHTDMDIATIARLIYDYTSGYPYLVSWLCKCIDEDISGSRGFPDRRTAWTKEGFLEAEKLLLNDKNTLFESLVNKLTDYPELKNVLYELLFTGKAIPYNPLNKYIETAEMFGFIKNENGSAVISNRIFETVLYNLFISEEYMDSKIYDVGLREKNQFVSGGHLDMRKVLEKFVEIFQYLYGDQKESFLEEAGRRYFMLFLKPIINGTGNCYVEPETRNRERMDLVVDYRGEQFVVELKIWHGDAYNKRGEEQISEYLEYYGLKKGYMISFNFNKKKKESGVKNVIVGDKVLIEAVV